MTQQQKRWTPAPTPTGPYSESYLDSALYTSEEADLLPLLIEPVIEQYHAEFTHRRPSTAWHVSQAINHLLLSLGLHENSELSDIMREKIQLYKAMCMEGGGPRGPKGRLAKLRHWQEIRVDKGVAVVVFETRALDKNPAESLELPSRTVAKERTKKGGFSDEQLSTIFRLLAPYRLDDEPLRIEWYWCVLCLAFNGARRAEIGQLLRSDVQRIDGVWGFSLIEPEDDRGDIKKELKNAPRHRIIPLHSDRGEASYSGLNSNQERGECFPLLWQRGLGKANALVFVPAEEKQVKSPSLSLHSFCHTLTVKPD